MPFNSTMRTSKAVVALAGADMAMVAPVAAVLVAAATARPSARPLRDLVLTPSGCSSGCCST